MTGSRTLAGRVFDRVLVGAAVIFTVLALRGIANLNQDGDAIDRGQQATTCIGDRQDAIDQWRAIATFEFVHQVDRLDQGLPVDVTLAEEAERAIYELVDEKQVLRAQQRDLIEEGETEFVCPPIDEDLDPPTIP